MGRRVEGWVGGWKDGLEGGRIGKRVRGKEGIFDNYNFRYDPYVNI